MHPFPYLSISQGAVIPRDEYVSGFNVHIVLVLCHRSHVHCWHDLQIH